MYPFYEKAVKAGINTLCIHKGLLPRLREVLRRRVRIRNGVGHRKGREGLAADELRDLSLGAAGLVTQGGIIPEWWATSSGMCHCRVGKGHLPGVRACLALEATSVHRGKADHLSAVQTLPPWTRLSPPTLREHA